MIGGRRHPADSASGYCHVAHAILRLHAQILLVYLDRALRYLTRETVRRGRETPGLAELLESASVDGLWTTPQGRQDLLRDAGQHRDTAALRESSLCRANDVADGRRLQQLCLRSRVAYGRAEEVRTLERRW